jgi:hypothetical protein
MHPNCEAVNDILQAAGLPGRVRMLDEAVTTARAAARHRVPSIRSRLAYAPPRRRPAAFSSSPIEHRYGTPPRPCGASTWTTPTAKGLRMHDTTVPSRSHRQFADLRNLQSFERRHARAAHKNCCRGATVDHDQWCPSGGHDQGRRTAVSFAPSRLAGVRTRTHRPAIGGSLPSAIHGPSGLSSIARSPSSTSFGLPAASRTPSFP